MLLFQDWMDHLDRIMAQRYCGMDTSDFPDYCWWDLWKDELDPQEAFEAWLEDPDYGPASA